MALRRLCWCLLRVTVEGSCGPQPVRAPCWVRDGRPTTVRGPAVYFSISAGVGLYFAYILCPRFHMVDDFKSLIRTVPRAVQWGASPGFILVGFAELLSARSSVVRLT